MTLSPEAVESIRRRYIGTEIAALAAAHADLGRGNEILLSLCERLAERVAKQSELLSKRAERSDVY